MAPTPIHAVGLACAAGNQPFALLGAVGTNLSCAIPHPSLSVTGLDGEEAPALFAPVPGFDLEVDRAERIAVLASAALASAVNDWGASLNGKKVLVVTLVPKMTDEELRRFELVLRGESPGLKDAALRFACADQGAVAALVSVIHELSSGAWDVVIFGGVDSLVNAAACRELLREGRLMTSESFEGIVPGEAAAYLVLQGADPSLAPEMKSLATISGIAHAPEPFTGQAHDQKMTGLAQSVEEACRQAGIDLAEVKEIILPFPPETASQLEWHQTAVRLWPPRAPQSRWDKPQHPEILRLHAALGELGAAALPVALVLGCARFEFDHPPLTSILVCEGGDVPVRGAVCLSAPRSESL